jgi:hypothetical protein
MFIWVNNTTDVAVALLERFLRGAFTAKDLAPHPRFTAYDTLDFGGEPNVEGRRRRRVGGSSRHGVGNDRNARWGRSGG